jgi:hypothetical protein
MARDRQMIGARGVALVAALGASASLVSGCSRSSDGGSATKSGAQGEAQAKGDTTAAPAAPSGPPLAGEDFYRVDAAPLPECAVGKACEVTLVLTALGEYKVNKDYPFKFVADPAKVSGGAVDGNGAFSHQGKQGGQMKVSFRPDAAGTAQLAGTFKLSVCTEATCEIAEPQIALAVPVK